MRHDVRISGMALSVHGYEFPKSEEYWDANWLSVSVILEGAGAKVTHSGTFLRTDELERFLGELIEMNALKSKSAALDPMEPNLALSIQCDGSLGALIARVSLTPDDLTQWHKFRFDCDLSHLPRIISDFERVLEAFPVRAKHHVQ